MRKILLVFLLAACLLLIGSTHYVTQSGRGLPPRWDDLRVPLATARILGQGSDADFDVFLGNTREFTFDPDTDEEVHFTVQLPHGYMLQSDLHPHIHWAPSTTNTGKVKWCLECTFQILGGVFVAPGDPMCVAQAASGVAYTHQLAEFGAISGTPFTLVSTIGSCRVYRDANDGTDDTYTGDAFGLEVDFHYIRDENGSVSEYDKWE